MDTRHDAIDRRTLLGAGAAALAAMSPARGAEVKSQLGVTAAPAEGDPKKKLSELIADFVVGFDLKNAPPLAIERTRLAFTDTIGVMLAGSREHVTQIACEMVKQEGSAPAAGVVGQSFRASPQLAALANGVAAHAMDYDFSYIMGQPMVPIIPALLPLAEQTHATPSEVMAAFIVGFEVASRMVRANTTQSLAGGLRAAPQAAGRADPRRDRDQRLARRWLLGQFRHHDQAAACGPGGAQRHDGGAARQPRLHGECCRARRQQRLLPRLRARARRDVRAVQ
jgi:hypothetical protein